MFVLTSAVFLLSLGFLYFLRSLVKANQTRELKNAETQIFYSIGNNRESLRELPYYIIYVVYDTDTQDILLSNDPFLPLLGDTKGRTVHYFEKDYFFDGNLDLIYFAGTHYYEGREICVVVAVNVENDSFSKIFSKLPVSFLLMAIPVFLLSFFVCLFITKRTINPVVKITKAAQAMTTENLDGQLPLSGRGDEIDNLSQTFNELFLRIKADFDRERQFSSDVSHELNTPLTVISGQANLLLRWGKDDPEQLEKSLNAIKNESNSMHSIIENLLQISRVESGRIKPSISQIDVTALFYRVQEEFFSVSPEVKFKIESKVLSKAEAEDPVLLNTDPEMLHQILTVLVANSVKFAGVDCTVQLCVQKQRAQIIISESDDGPGINGEALPHIFERFYRADEAHSRNVGGSGLGLSIAKTLCQALGAQITADNVKPHGARFKIVFPIG